MSTKITRGKFLAGAGAGAAALAVTGPEMFLVEASDKPIIIGTKNFTEENIAAYLYYELLTHLGLRVDDPLKHSFGSTSLIHEALIHDQIDMYPEYTGTGLVAVLGKQFKPGESPHKVFTIVKNAYKRKWNLVWLNPAAMNDPNAFGTSKAKAKKFHLKTLSDLAHHASQIRLTVLQECTQREDCLLGYDKVYHHKAWKELNTVGSSGLLYQALNSGNADVIQVFGTDAGIITYDVQVLVDDKNFFPPYQMAPVVHPKLLKKHPKVRNYLNGLAPHLTNHAFQKMNLQVDGQGKKPRAVAHAFLKKHKLI